MRCQVLYDIRESTAWISGNDLHELFKKLVGEPSPSGKKEIPSDLLAKYIREKDPVLDGILIALATMGQMEECLEFQVNAMHRGAYVCK